jgi:hypothetical protein
VASLQDDSVGVATALSPVGAGHFKFYHTTFIVRLGLAIPLNVFAEALDGFADVNGELIIEMFERKGERYIRLGETAKYNCRD